MTAEALIIKHPTAWVQLSAVGNTNKMNYFNDKVLPCWSDYLKIYTTALRINCARDEGEGNKFVAVFSIPKLDKLESKMNWMVVKDDKTAYFSALLFALQNLLEIPFEDAKVVLFCKSDGALSRVLQVLDHENNIEDHEKELKNIIKSLNLKGKTIAFAWMPAENEIKEYNHVNNFAKSFFDNDDSDSDCSEFLLDDYYNGSDDSYYDQVSVKSFDSIDYFYTSD